MINKYYGKMDKVVFIIPSTAKVAEPYKTIDEMPLLKILYNSIKAHDISNYTFIVGIDDDDEFYINNQEKIKEVLPSNFHLHFFNNCKKSYVSIVNQLANVAINEYKAEYLQIFADDLIVYSLTHIPTFIDYFKKHDNLCLGWGKDENVVHTCTHPFIHKTHVNIFDYFYPNEIINWHCDDWILGLYTKLNRIVITDTHVLANCIGVRYNTHYIPPDAFDEMVNESYKIIIPFATGCKSWSKRMHELEQVKEKHESNNEVVSKVLSLENPNHVSNFSLGKDVPSYLVVDNFYENPDAVRSFALSLDFNFHPNYHKGQRTDLCYRFDGLKERFEQLVGRKITNWDNYGTNGCFQYCIDGDQIVYHCDTQQYAGVLFLTPNAPVNTGTGLFRSVHTKKMKVSNEECHIVFQNGFLDQTQFERVDTVGNVYNRLVLFDSLNIHAACEYFGTTKKNGRLFQLFFFDLE
jgi:hypothetical protein